MLNLKTSIFLIIISLLILSNTTEMKNKKNETVIMRSGINIEESIDGELNFEMLAGWCSVFHQSTDHLIIGKFTMPISVNIDAFLSPFLLSSKALEIKI